MYPTTNDIIDAALAIDALQTHVDAGGDGIDVRLRPALERCCGAALAAVRAACPDPSALPEGWGDTLEMLGACRLLAMVYAGTDGLRAVYYAQAADDAASRIAAAGACPGTRAPSWG